jgi:phage tail sheath protein FI
MSLSHFHISPGVYTQEIDLSDRIAAVSSSIAAVVGASKKGPVNDRTLITSQKEFIEVFGIPDPTVSFMHYAALIFLSESTRLYVTRVVNNDTTTAGAYLTVDDPTADKPILRLTNFDDGTSTPKGVRSPLDNIYFTPTDPATSNTLFFVCAANPGAWNNEIAVQIRPNDVPGLPSPTGKDPYDFYVDVFVDYKGTADIPVESFFVSREYKLDDAGNQLFIEDVINSKSQYIRVRNNPYCAQIKILSDVFEYFDGASDGTPPDNFDIMQAWDLYLDTEQVDVNILINAGYSAPEIQRKMDYVCQYRKDCIALLDIPTLKQQTADAMIYRNNELNLDSSYSALYTPDIGVFDAYNGMEVMVPPSAFAAAICARTDANAELWFAPAGLNRGAIRTTKIAQIYNQVARDALDSENINYVRFIPTIGYAMWNQATLQSKASARSFLNVRRLLNFIEKSIAVSALYSVFEPNDMLLQTFLRNLVSSFLEPIKNKRGLYDYKVICDGSNNTPGVVANGDLVLDVYLDPTIPSKRIHLNAIITKTGASFRETAMMLSATGLSI